MMPIGECINDMCMQGIERQYLQTGAQGSLSIMAGLQLSCFLTGQLCFAGSLPAVTCVYQQKP